MKRYIVDANVFLRFLLKDHKKYYQTAKKYFTQAKEGKLVLILIPEVVLEINYVLRGVYSLSRKKTADILIKLVKSPDLKVQEQKVLVETIEKYRKVNVDLVDLFIYEKAQKAKAEILSFDKDFRKISKKTKQL